MRKFAYIYDILLTNKFTVMRVSSILRITVLFCTFLFVISCSSASTVSKDGKAPEVEPKYYNIEYVKVFAGAIEAVNAMEWQITFADKEIGIISAKTPTSLLTWGDEISIKVRKPENNRVRVDVSAGTSRQMIDWGKNRGNINNFYQQLDDILLK
ncbi:hypothetical protein CR164_09880 [Prosthecochloris marina]|uniref:DUF1499 domain-containing protein n=1 Tax=Prosthecochloris marina TaxID=2017681 RepID=A0A317T7B9_9CHLB|nr:DUF1499 domain-containing protein [Prosthecochloris marina]PWW81341.1 hypothetical protein CR164_09880 [Prosthecochloris marina]